jgi:peroxiredoxin
MPLVLILLVLINKRIKYGFIISMALLFGFLADNKELAIGSQAPDFSVKLYNNKDFKLSSLKGSYTLVQFWASWDLPSLKSHAKLIKTYNQFKDFKFIDGKKFNIVAISIDQKAETYKTAIARENLPDNYLICDFKGWNSPIIDTFKIEHIPANFLLDPKGIIIAKNIFNDEIEVELDKYTKNFKK